jgi:carboxyl-terminal processing protease
MYGHGAYLLPLPEAQVAEVIDVWPDSPADKAGLSGQDIVLKVNGQSVLNENKVRCIQPSQEVKLTIQKSTNDVEDIVLHTTSVNYPYPAYWLVINGSNENKVGYIRFIGFDEYTSGLFESGFREIEKLSQPIGLIIDARVNVGGRHAYLKQVLSFFIDGSLGHYESPSVNFPPKPFDVPVPQSNVIPRGIPLVVLTSHNTYSAGELFAGFLQNAKRAYIIGENTPGNVSVLWDYSLLDGSTLSLPVMSLLPNDNNANWEKGIIPDKLVSCNWRDCFTENDPVIGAAVDYLQALITH